MTEGGRSYFSLVTCADLCYFCTFSNLSRVVIPKAAIDEFWKTKAADWLQVNSQGLYNIEATVIDWITTDNTEIYYSFGERGMVKEAQQMAWPSLNNLDNRPDWDWSKFDLDDNGDLDSVVIIHSGYGKL